METTATFYAEIADQLVLWTKQHAWYSTVPEKSSKPRRSGLAEPIMPPVPWQANYLLEMLFDIGPVMPVGMGNGSISEQELRAYQDNQGIELTWWECSILKMLSREYAAQLSLTGRNDARPYVSPAEMDAERRNKVADAMLKWAAVMVK